jgi:hypothetical protein
MYDFAQSIEVIVLWQRRTKLDELVCIDYNRPIRREQNIRSRLARNSERKGRLIRPGNLKVAVRCTSTCVSNTWPGDNGLRKNEPCLILRSDIPRLNLDMNSVCCLIFHRQCKVGDVVAVHVASWACNIQVGCESARGGGHSRGRIAWTDILDIDGLRILDVRKYILALVSI